MRNTLFCALLALLLVLMTPGGAYSYPYENHVTNQHQQTRGWVLIGDSIAGQVDPLAGKYAEARDVNYQGWAKSGGAPCDFLPTYGKRMTDFRSKFGAYPQDVSIAFVGNATSPCMEAALGRPPGVLSQSQQNAITTKYYTDLRAMIHWNQVYHVRTWLVLPPKMGPGTWHGQVNDELITRYTQLAAAPGVATDGGPREMLTPNGVYRDYVKIDGVNRQLRYKDRTHLELPVGQAYYVTGLFLHPFLDPR